MTTTLLIVVALKAVCLIFCWKAIVIAKKNSAGTQQHGADTNMPNIKTQSKSAVSLDELETKMAKLVEQNQKLTKQLHTIKEKKSS